MYKNKFLPQNYVAEEILLGMIIVYPSVFYHVNKYLKQEYFFLESHRLIYINMLIIYKNQRIDIIELIYQLQSNTLLKKIGGLKKIFNMMKQSQIFISSSTVKIYSDALNQLIILSYIRRTIIQYGYKMIQLAYINNIDNEYMYNRLKFYLDWIEKELQNHLNNNSSIVNIKELLSKKLIEIKNPQKQLKHNIENTLIYSGFINIDNVIKGFPNGSLIIIAGRPSIGKTSLAINIAYKILIDNYQSICIFSLEMSSKEILHKFMSIASKTYISEKTIHKLDKKRWKQIIEFCDKLLENNIYINNTYNISIQSIEKTTKNLKKNYNIQLIIIDYLQLIECSINSKQYTYNRSQELGYITRKLKLLAQSLHLPIIVLSQLNRNIETRSNKEPLLSDLKESGCIKNNHYLNIFDSFNNSINLTNIINKSINIRTLKSNYHNKDNNSKINIHKTNCFTITKYIKKSIYSNNAYLFKCKKKIKNISLTHNHKYLYKKLWTRTNQITKFVTINIKKVLYKETIKKNLIINIEYINKILFNNYYKSYDLNQENEFNIICNNTILHNSIEQDADIIMMLYNKKNASNILEEINILDIKIAKNRNGSTGSCQMQFITNKAIFQDIQN
uniref:DNA 5'-3' helicase n=1 Tax=Kuetzingia canaliculata TaxID=228262 RepID=A0A1Z1MPD9_KUECA|nr:Replication helicase subunit [Kuetzingia canaliculata]ARW67957.1 Replication helicase subunit [Kuetzingia canaliculata]